VLSAAGLIALADAAIETLVAAGVRRPNATRAILALMQSALRGASFRGLQQALTGPVPRGDLKTIRTHIASLSPSLRRLYALLGSRALSLAKEQLPPKTRRDLAQALLRNA
jgi:predicted short-subunit dehydrogenase-like oxidoreductase (DUF2520 family)